MKIQTGFNMIKTVGIYAPPGAGKTSLGKAISKLYTVADSDDYNCDLDAAVRTAPEVVISNFIRVAYHEGVAHSVAFAYPKDEWVRRVSFKCPQLVGDRTLQDTWYRDVTKYLHRASCVIVTERDCVYSIDLVMARLREWLPGDRPA